MSEIMKINILNTSKYIGKEYNHLNNLNFMTNPS